MKRFLWSLAYGLAGWAALYGQRLTLLPDANCYARGGCGWSSPLDALAGHLGGLAAVRLLALASVIALGALLASLGSVPAAVVLAFMCFVPHEPGLAAGPAAAGAVAVLLLRRSRLWPVAAIAHLQAALVSGCSALAARSGYHSPLVPIAAAAASIVALALIGVLTGAGVEQLQTRYLLPGVVLAVAR